jgi:hypothetical protein
MGKAFLLLVALGLFMSGGEMIGNAMHNYSILGFMRQPELQAMIIGGGALVVGAFIVLYVLRSVFGSRGPGVVIHYHDDRK